MAGFGISAGSPGSNYGKTRAQKSYRSLGGGGGSSYGGGAAARQPRQAPAPRMPAPPRMPAGPGGGGGAGPGGGTRGGPAGASGYLANRMADYKAGRTGAGGTGFGGGGGGGGYGGGYGGGGAKTPPNKYGKGQGPRDPRIDQAWGQLQDRMGEDDTKRRVGQATGNIADAASMQKEQMLERLAASGRGGGGAGGGMAGAGQRDLNEISGNAAIRSAGVTGQIQLGQQERGDRLAGMGMQHAGDQGRYGMANEQLGMAGDRVNLDRMDFGLRQDAQNFGQGMAGAEFERGNYDQDYSNWLGMMQLYGYG